jgi:bifunctional non-homologous end joining protein LigD
LDELELPSYVKTSGATGLHLLIPLGARYSHEEARTFGRLLALLETESEPDLATVVRSPQARGGKVYVDTVQNGHGRTIVAPFSVRSLPGAPVSCSLRWSEVTARLDPNRFTIKTAPHRFEKLGDPLSPVLESTVDLAAALSRIEQLLERKGAGKAALRHARQHLSL